MNYIKANKKAWEEAFSHRKNGWGEDVAENLQSKPDFYINPTIKSALDQQDLSSKRVAHFCCNNGRELLSVAKYYGAEGTGIDIAENLVLQGNQTSEKLGLPCKFLAANILDIGEAYNGSFDLVLFTIGAITWFKDLEELFHVVSRCLKPNGVMILHEIHPVMNILPLPDEDGYRSDIAVALEHNILQRSRGLRPTEWGISPESMNPKHLQALPTLWRKS